MYLHDNKDNFGIIVRNTSKQFGVSEASVEKDYYNFIILKKITYLVMGNVILAGKNSLVKGYGVTEPALEDIELYVPGVNAKNKRFGADLECAVKRAALNLNIKALEHDEQECIEYCCESWTGQEKPLKVYVDKNKKWDRTEIISMDSYIGKYLRDFKPGLDREYWLDEFPMAIAHYINILVDMIYTVSDAYITGKAIHPGYLSDIRDIMQYIVLKSMNNVNIMKDTAKTYNTMRKQRSKQGFVGGVKRAFVELVSSDFCKDAYSLLVGDEHSYEKCKGDILNFLRMGII